VPLAALGSFVGDNISYGLGHFVGDPVADKLFRGEKGERRLERARQALESRGGTLIVAARFIPGGRTVTTFAAGTLGYPWRRFVAFDALAAVIWGSYGGFLGYLGGSTFEHSTWKPLLVAFGIAAVAGGLLELVRRLRGRQLGL
jgi:membrane protein DedA with SNARE-associated domain